MVLPRPPDGRTCGASQACSGPRHAGKYDDHHVEEFMKKKDAIQVEEDEDMDKKERSSAVSVRDGARVLRTAQELGARTRS